MSNKRFAIFGTGFWSSYQLAGWKELKGVECVALYNRTLSKAEKLANKFNVAKVYDNPDKLLANENIDFVDVITNNDTHSKFVHLAAKYKIPVISQKPLAPSLEEAEKMVTVCNQANIPFFVHENWRWQYPIRQYKKLLDERKIGTPFKARIHYCSSFPVFENQPFLKELKQFILIDMGTHILDVARFLFGEAETLYCHTNRINSEIKGEDYATVMIKTKSGMTVLCELSYASRTEQEHFPETYIYTEGERGSLDLVKGYDIRITSGSGTESKRYPPPQYPWADRAYDVVQSSIVACNANILKALQGKGKAETTGEDNLRTLKLVFAAYESAASGKAITIE